MSEITPKREGALTGLDLGGAIEAAAALGKDGVEVIERLHAIQSEERASAAKAAFVRAMNGLRRAMPRIEKTRDGQHGVKKAGTKTLGKFAPLDDITKVLDPYCEEFGFIYDFDREVLPNRNEDYVVCIVTHEDGHEKRSHFPAPAGDRNKATNANQANAIGEAYARRYALCAAFGIVTADPDTDGNVGTPDMGPSIDDEQALEIEALIDAAGMDEGGVKRFLKWAEADSISAISASKRGQAISLLQRKIKAARG